MTRQWAERLAPHLGVSPQSLIFPEDPRVPVVGLVGAGGSISTELENDGFDALFEIELPFVLSEEAVAFQVSGDSMFPVYNDGDVIVVSRAGSPAETLLGLEAVVKVGGRDEPGDRFFKRVLRGSSAATFDLESYNAPTIRDVAIGWASSLIVRVPAAQLRRRNGGAAKPSAPRRLTKKD